MPSLPCNLVWFFAEPNAAFVGLSQRSTSRTRRSLRDFSIGLLHKLTDKPLASFLSFSSQGLLWSSPLASTNQPIACPTMKEFALSLNRIGLHSVLILNCVLRSSFLQVANETIAGERDDRNLIVADWDTREKSARNLRCPTLSGFVSRWLEHSYPLLATSGYLHCGSNYMIDSWRMQMMPLAPELFFKLMHGTLV